MKSEQMDGAQALLKTLDDLGIEYIFGYSGGAALPIFDALETVPTWGPMWGPTWAHVSPRTHRCWRKKTNSEIPKGPKGTHSV